MQIRNLEKRLEALEADAQVDEIEIDVHFIGMDGIVTKILEIRRDQKNVERDPTAEEIAKSAEEWRLRQTDGGA